VLDALAPGDWTIWVRCAGFSDRTVPHRVNGAPLVISLTRTGRIAGQVLGVDTEPVVAEVTLAGSGVWPPRNTSTDAQGRFVLLDVPPGIYEVQARTADAVAPPRRGLTIEAGSSAFVRFDLERGEAMLGSVTDAETGRGIAHAEVVVMPDALGVAPRVTHSGLDGHFRLDGLRHAPHQVSVYAPEHVPVIGAAWMPGTRLAVRMEPGALIEGSIRDARGEPVAGARIELLGETGDRQPISLDGASLAFRETLYPDRATLTAPSSAASHTLELMETVPPIPDESSVGATVSAVVATPAAPTMQSGADGTFVLRGIPPGRVQLIVRAAGYSATTTDRLWITAGHGIQGLDIRLAAAGRIEGRVIDAAGNPVTGASVEHLSDLDPWARLALTDDDGAFVLDDVAGAVTIRPFARGQAGMQVRVEVEPGSTEQITLELPPVGPTLRGVTVDPRGRPIAGAQVRMESMAPGVLPPRVAFSDDAGEFEFEDAPRPPWQLNVDHANHARSAPIDVEEAPSAPIRLTLDDAVELTGRLLDPLSGAGVEDGEVVLESERVPPVIRRARADSAGAFVIPRVAAGSYRLVASAEGRVVQASVVEIPPGAVRREGFDLPPVELEAAASLEGDVVDSLGRTVQGAEVSVSSRASPPARSDRRGHFVLEGLASGRIECIARHPSVGEAVRVVRVSPERNPAPVVFHLPGRFDPDAEASERALRRGVAIEVADDHGAVVVSDVVGPLAAAAGLRSGDVLLEVDGTEPTEAQAAARRLRGADGVSAVLRLARAGHAFRLRVPREPW
jgi:hypothetical protein